MGRGIVRNVRRAGVVLAAGLSFLLMNAGCHESEARLNAPPHGVPEKVNEMQGTFVYMNDNALLADMTVSDIHFMPHRPLLNTLGKQRLSRLASLMEAYGGTVRLSTDLEDEGLLQQRMETVRGFLNEAGLSVTADTVRRELPGGNGMRATEAILIMKNEGTYKPKKEEGGSMPMLPMGGSGGAGNP